MKLWIFVGIVLVVAFILVIYFYVNLKNREKYRKIAQDLIKSIEQKETIFNSNTDDVTKVSQSQTILEYKIGKSISEDVVQFILRELDTFEKNAFFKKGITLSSLSKQIKQILLIYQILSILTKEKTLQLILMIYELTMH